MYICNIAVAILTSGLVAGGAQAGVCRAPTPSVGEVIHGPVLHVLDGQRFCVALGASPDRWVELALDDAGLVRASEVQDANPRGTLMAAAFAQNVTCRVTAVDAGRARAACTLNGRPLGEVARRTGATGLGATWR